MQSIKNYLANIIIILSVIVLIGSAKSGFAKS